MLSWLSELFDSFSSFLREVLPGSPLRGFIDGYLYDIPLLYIRYINWFVPVDVCLSIFLSWLVALSIYYLYVVIMRWVKVVS